MPSAGQLRQGWLDDLAFLEAELPGLSGVRVQAADAQSRRRDAEPPPQALVAQAADLDDLLGRHAADRVDERHVDRDEDHAERPAGKEHGHLGRAELLGQEFRVPRPRVAGHADGLLGDRGGGDGVDPAALRRLDGRQDVADTGLAAGLARGADGQVVRHVAGRDEFHALDMPVPFLEGVLVGDERRHAAAQLDPPDERAPEDDEPGHPPRPLVHQRRATTSGPMPAGSPNVMPMRGRGLVDIFDFRFRIFD